MVIKRSISQIFGKRVRRGYTYIKSKNGSNLKGLQTGILSRYTGGAKVVEPLTKRMIIKVKNFHNWHEKSIESFRLLLQNFSKPFGVANYWFRIKTVPHQIIRYHKVASGAQADRISMGMRLAFGKPLTKAAKVRVGTEILEYRYLNPLLEQKIKKGLEKAKYTLPFKFNLIFDQDPK